ncbi:MAG: VWA domain-containing protein [Thermoguttaceae bacterium]|nr:VWA domain-containing protein [Thermoguttaceae bacterium]
MNFEFHSPLWLLLLIPWTIAVLSFAFPFGKRRQSSSAILFPDVSSLRDLPVTFALRIKRLLPLVLFLAGVCAIVALARPRQGEEEFRVQTEGIAIEMVVDRSGSMRALDFKVNGRQVNRLEAIKDVFKRFVIGDGVLEGRPNDNIGLISFGGYAEDRCPLTLDHDALISVLNEVNISDPIYDDRGRLLNEHLVQEENSTAIGDALAEGVERLRNAEEKSKIMIFLSDGEQTAGELTPEQGTALAKKYGIKVYTIGIGSNGLTDVPTMLSNGRVIMQKGIMRLDEETLKNIAKETGGVYFNAKSTKALEQVYQAIDKLEKSKIEGQMYTHYKEWFTVPLWTSLILILAYVLLTTTRFRSLP